MIGDRWAYMEDANGRLGLLRFALPAPTMSLLAQAFAIPVLAVGIEAAVPFAMPGVAVGMGVVVNVRGSSAFAPFIYAWVSAANTVTVAYRALVSANLSVASVTVDLHVIP